jgi:hypothetical protein
VIIRDLLMPRPEVIDVDLRVVETGLTHIQFLRGSVLLIRLASIFSRGEVLFLITGLVVSARCEIERLIHVFFERLLVLGLVGLSIAVEGDVHLFFGDLFKGRHASGGALVALEQASAFDLNVV